MTKTETEKNLKRMQLIKRAHGLLENTDIEKQRVSQEHVGALLRRNKDLVYQDERIGQIACEWVRPVRAHEKHRIILHCHGGGYSTGSFQYARTLTAKLALACGWDVLCFDYRLAPEHPYPAALEDALAVWDHLMRMGYGARNVLVTGDSAGGNLALALTLRLREEKRFLPGALVLLSPWTDLTSSGDSFREKEEVDPVLNPEYIRKMVDAYGKYYDLTDPYISPLFADFTGFPPTYIQVGENEILLSDASRLYQKMKQCGVAVKLEEFAGMWHVFQMAPFKQATEAIDRIGEFIFSL